MHARTRRQTWLRVAGSLCVCALAAGGAAAVAAHRTGSGRSQAFGRPPVISSSRPHPCVSVAQRRISPAGRLLVVGASYTAGEGATSQHDGYAWDLARALDQTPRVDGVDGTGFVNRGRRHQGSFGQRLARLPVHPTPDLVLIQGGRDDAYVSARSEVAAASRTLCRTERRFAPARVAVLGPVPAHFPIDHEILGIDADLRTACRYRDALYIDPIRERWMTPALARRFAGPVPRHPNDLGYRYIAARAAADLRADLDRSRA